jgi:hypothetical protein
VSGSLLHRARALWLTVAVVLCAAAASEIGFRIASRRRSRSEDGSPSIGAVEGIVFGLFGLLIAFTFSFVVARFEQRRQLVVEETNAIETSYLRAAVAPVPGRDALEDLHRRYLASRLAFVAAGTGRGRERRALEESHALQTELWARGVALAQRHPASEPYGLMLAALNEMFDLRTKRVGALAARLPDPVVVLLLVTAVLTASVSGYALGLHGERHPMPSAVILILIAVVLYIILDIDRPQRGVLRTRETALVELAERLGATAPRVAPPAPGS